MIKGLSMVNKGIPPLYVKPQYHVVFLFKRWEMVWSTCVSCIYVDE